MLLKTAQNAIPLLVLLKILLFMFHLNSTPRLIFTVRVLKSSLIHLPRLQGILMKREWVKTSEKPIDPMSKFSMSLCSANSNGLLYMMQTLIKKDALFARLPNEEEFQEFTDKSVVYLCIKLLQKQQVCWPFPHLKDQKKKPYPLDDVSSLENTLIKNQISNNNISID